MRRLGDFAEQIETEARDSDPNDAPIFRRSLPSHQAPLFELVEHAGDVRRPRDQPFRQTQGWQNRRVLRTQQPEQVVLLRRQVEARERLILQGPQPVIRPPQVQKGFLLRRIEPQRGRRPPLTHRHDNPLENSCPDNYP